MSGRKGDTDGVNKPSRQSDKVGVVDNAEFRGYINLELTDAQKDTYPTWAASEAFWSALQAFTEGGVNLSLKRERKSGGFLASATQRDPASVNAGLCVTARGKDAGTAFGRVLFCLTILARKERWEEVQAMANPDRW
jgi:hypothetical protein